jgi:drug/metabolite transporter (DMT)-like permease
MILSLKTKIFLISLLQYISKKFSEARFHLALVLAAFCYSSLVVSTKYLSVHSFTFFEQLFWRVLIGTLISGLILLIMNPKDLRVKKSDLKEYFLSALIFLGGFSTFIGGIYLGTPIAKATALNYCYPLVVVVLAHWWLKEKISFKQIAAVFLSIISALIIMQFWEIKNYTDFKLGELVSLANALFYGLIIIFGRLTQRDNSNNPFQLLFFSHLILLPMVLLECIIFNQFISSGDFRIDFSHTFTISEWLILSFSSLIGGVMPLALIYYGTKKVSSTQASLLLLTEPLWVYLLGLIIFAEKLNLYEILGMFGIILSVLMA